MSKIAWCAAGLAILLGTEVAAAEGQRPLREVQSENKHFVLRIEPGRPGRAGRSCQATLFKRSERNQRGRKVWERALVNDVAPMAAFIRNDGRFLVTLDEYRCGGARHALVVYGAQGQLLRHFLLQDLLSKSDWEHVKVSRREVSWLKDARCAFADEQGRFIIELKWGRTVRIDLKMLQVVGEDGRPAGGVLAAIPAEVLLELLGHLEKDGEQIIAERLAELAELSPEERAGAEAVAEQLSPEDQAGGLEEVAATEEEVPEVALADDAAVAELPADDVATVAEAPAGVEPEVVDAEVSPDVVPDVEERSAEVHIYAGLEIPAPNPADKTDYIAWVNELGVVEGPDAAPIYDAAVAQLVNPDEQKDVLRAASHGDQDALASPELAAWLAENGTALDTFREASRYPARSWEHHTESGAVFDILLPNLSPMRQLAYGAVAEGRFLAAEGRPAEAAERFLDTLAAGHHISQGFTLIEDLVGVAMQALATEALLDLVADPATAELDFMSLADEVEAAYSPARSSAVSIQGERAFFMDCTQRLWDVDPQTGRTVLNPEKAREFISMVGVEDNDSPEGSSIMAEMLQADYEQTVADGDSYYDTLTTAVSLPYPEASRQLEELEAELVDNKDKSPLVRHLMPSLSRYHYIKVRGEANRRSALLVTNIQAYRQEYGEYPTALDVFAERDFAVDPFSNSGFIYRREGDSFVLYSTGGNLADDGGVHDRRGDTNDLVFWPRPE
ncbi:MAG: hypothetical protein KAY37_13585 [Phycisphaerae bacterium]|nr:hypothetical protein [Phycisphaerae bacterium]